MRRFIYAPTCSPTSSLCLSLHFSTSRTVLSIRRLLCSRFPLLLYCIACFREVTGCDDTWHIEFFHESAKKSPRLRKSVWWSDLVYVGKTIMYNSSAKIFKCVFQINPVSHLWWWFRAAVFFFSKLQDFWNLGRLWWQNKIWQNGTYLHVFKVQGGGSCFQDYRWLHLHPIQMCVDEILNDQFKRGGTLALRVSYGI